MAALRPLAAPLIDTPVGDRAASDSIHRRPGDRKALLRHDRSSPAPAARLRCHILLLLDAGHPWELIAAVPFTSAVFMDEPDRSKVVRAYLAAWGGRVRVHSRPKYAPDTNPVKEVWWRLPESVTRNHSCGSMTETVGRGWRHLISCFSCLSW
jgi:hypothetical protein